jgi:pyruvate/2-oxoglutarate dehydrogenase complex dihydrolipoamide dehydrogenase (E3) component
LKFLSDEAEFCSAYGESADPKPSAAVRAGETQGFMKVLVDAETQRLPDAANLGLNGDAVVHALLDVMAADQLYTGI